MTFLYPINTWYIEYDVYEPYACCNVHHYILNLYFDQIILMLTVINLDLFYLNFACVFINYCLQYVGIFLLLTIWSGFLSLS